MKRVFAPCFRSVDHHCRLRAGLPGQADQSSSCRPRPAGRPTRSRACSRGDGRGAQAADDHRERRRRRRHHRHQPRGEGEARRLHAAALSRRHGDFAGAVPQAAVRHAQRLRLHRPGRRRADDADRQEGDAGEQLRRVPRLREGQQGQAHLRQRRPRLRVLPVRHPVHERDRRQLHHGAVQGHRAGDERPLGGQVDFMCDQTTNTGAADQVRQREGLRRDHARRAWPRCPTCRR